MSLVNKDNEHLLVQFSIKDKVFSSLKFCMLDYADIVNEIIGILSMMSQDETNLKAKELLWQSEREKKFAAEANLSIIEAEKQKFMDEASTVVDWLLITIRDCWYTRRNLSLIEKENNDFLCYMMMTVNTFKINAVDLENLLFGKSYKNPDIKIAIKSFIIRLLSRTWFDFYDDENCSWTTTLDSSESIDKMANGDFLFLSEVILNVLHENAKDAIKSIAAILPKEISKRNISEDIKKKLGIEAQ